MCVVEYVDRLVFGIGEYRFPVALATDHAPFGIPKGKVSIDRNRQRSIADWVHGLDGFVFEEMGVEEVWFKLET